MSEAPTVVYLAMKPEEMKILISAGNRLLRSIEREIADQGKQCVQDMPAQKKRLRLATARATTLKSALTAMGRALDRQNFEAHTNRENPTDDLPSPAPQGA